MRNPSRLLKTLTDKTKLLKENKRRQLGELVVATGADALDVETPVGGLLAMVKTTDTTHRETWRKQGAAFFRKAPGVKERASGSSKSDTASHSGQTPASGPTRQA